MATFFIRKAYLEKLNQVNSCCYCGRTSDLSIDHIHPRNKGGTNDLHNLTKACKRCNSLKGAFFIDEYYCRVLEKRDILFNKFLVYSARFRRERKRGNHPDLQAWLLEKMILCRSEHTYFTSIIHSITREKYRLYERN